MGICIGQIKRWICGHVGYSAISGLVFQPNPATSSTKINAMQRQYHQRTVGPAPARPDRMLSPSEQAQSDPSHNYDGAVVMDDGFRVLRAQEGRRRKDFLVQCSRVTSLSLRFRLPSLLFRRFLGVPGHIPVKARYRRR